MADPFLRVCYFGTYRAEYSRNRIMIAGLRQHGVQVIECHEPLWRGIEDRVAAVGGGWMHPSFWWRVLRVYIRLIWKFWRIGQEYDVLIVGYPGQFDVYLARLLSWFQRKPLAWDIFMSVYLIAVERGLDAKSAATIKLIRWVERIACRLPNLLIIDTHEYAQWFEETHGIPARSFHLVPTGADDRIFRPQVSVRRASDTFRVLYYGTFIPNHGVMTIVKAAHLLADDLSIQFELVGDGPDRKEVERLAQHYGLANLSFTGWMEPAMLRQRIADADLCLGVFGVTPQSLMTVQNKIYEGLAMGKPVLTGDGPAVRAHFVHGEHLYLCARADADALAAAIRDLQGDPQLRARLGQRGYEHFCASFTLDGIGRQFHAGLQRLRPGVPQMNRNEQG